MSVLRVSLDACLDEIPLGYVLRPGGGATLLRTVATTSRSGDIWTAAHDEVSSGELVNVLGSSSSSSSSSDTFMWIRTDAGVEGFLNAAYVEQLVTVQRPSGSVSTTLLRKIATTKRSGDVWTTPSAHVANGEVVKVLRAAKSSSGGSKFAWIRTSAGAEGFLNAKYVKQLATVHRPSGSVSTTLLRKTATTSRASSVWTTPSVQVANGDVVTVLHAAKSTSGSGNFAWIRTAAGSEGFIRMKYLTLGAAAAAAAMPMPNPHAAAPPLPSIPITGLPAHWTAMTTAKPVDLVDLPGGSAEHAKVLAGFRSTVSTHTVSRIRRIQNAQKWLKFKSSHETIAKLRPSMGANVNDSVYHGTKASVVDKICTQGFDRSFSAVAMYGTGTYFARDARYSANDSYSVQDSNGVKRMIVCRIIVGVPCVGKRGMTQPSLVGAGAQLADSMVDCIANPSIFVLSSGSDDHAYPEYIVDFH